MNRQIEAKIINPLIHQFGLPKYATADSAAMDLVACIEQPLVIEGNQQVKVGSGIALNMQDDHLVALLVGRSGMAYKHGLRLANSVGVIDAGYQNEIGILLKNDSNTPYQLQPGERIAQLMFVPIILARLKFVSDFDEQTERGLGGFGHTGKISIESTIF